MQALHILIVDDERPARKKIHSFLKEEAGVGSISEAENGLEAVKLIQENKPDLVFLDIQMPGMNGFEVIETVGVENMPAVVFVTAYDQYALEAFEVQALDYLLKPFDQERFLKSFNRAVEQIQLKNENTAVFKSCSERSTARKNISKGSWSMPAPDSSLSKPATLCIFRRTRNMSSSTPKKRPT